MSVSYRQRIKIMKKPFHKSKSFFLEQTFFQIYYFFVLLVVISLMHYLLTIKKMSIIFIYIILFLILILITIIILVKPNVLFRPNKKLKSDLKSFFYMFSDFFKAIPTWWRIDVFPLLQWLYYKCLTGRPPYYDFSIIRRWLWNLRRFLFWLIKFLFFFWILLLLFNLYRNGLIVYNDVIYFFSLSYIKKFFSYFLSNFFFFF